MAGLDPLGVLSHPAAMLRGKQQGISTPVPFGVLLFCAAAYCRGAGALVCWSAGVLMCLLYVTVKRGLYVTARYIYSPKRVPKHSL